MIYSPRAHPVERPLLMRLIALGLVLASGAILVTAARVEPSRTGLATHLELGMQPCSFLQRTGGIPCASCGMTTSFAWFARGNILASLYTQPMGTVLASLNAMLFCGALYVVATGRPVYRLMNHVPARYLVIPLIAFALLAWGWKIYLRVSGIDGW